VVNFWSGVSNISLDDLRALLSGAKTKDFSSVVVETNQSQALVDTLGLAIEEVHELPAAQLMAALKPGLLGLVRIEDLGPQVSALAIDGLRLFGPEHLSDFARWPLRIAAPNSSFDYRDLWTLAGGGDVNLDRSVYRVAVTKGAGPDYPWAGGRSVVSGHFCCGVGRNSLAAGSTIAGSGGAFRAAFADADLALVNLEGPAPNQHSYHPDGFTFTFDPALLAGLSYAGIDAVGLANNHIRNAGSAGVTQTCANLDAVGVAHAGAGVNLAAAYAPAWLSAGGQRIAFLAFDAINSANYATASRPGAAPLNISQAVAAIKAARAAGADLVVVMPHWGTEYSTAISARQKSQAAAMIAAGADVILGSHSHWTNGIAFTPTTRGDAFTIYSLGDLLFDLNYDERTQEAVIAELTFDGTRLLQVQLVPTLLLKYSQGSILTGPAAATVLDQIRRATP
jgi:hypothetical protein